MRILDRYIFKSALTVFITCVFLFLFLYVVIDLLTNLEDIIKQHVGCKILIKYYLWFLPIMFVQVSPFACLLSAMYTLGRLNHTNEIIAMRSSGLSVYQITKTVIILGLLVTVLVLWLNDRVLPRARMATQQLREMMWEGKKRSRGQNDIIDNLTMMGLNNRLFYINKFSASANRMEDIILLEHDEHQNVARKIVANKGVYRDGSWKFYQCITYNFDRHGQVIQEPRYNEEEVMVISETPKDFLNRRQRSENMTVSELEDYLWKLSRSGATSVIRGFRIDLYQRFAAPFTNVIIVLLAVPFAMTMKRRAAGLSAIGLSLLVGFIYYIAEAVSIAIGKGGAFLAPALAASLSHIIAFLSAAYLISKLP